MLVSRLAPCPQVRNTHVLKKTLSPAWLSEFVFRGELRWLLTETLELEVFDADEKTADDSLGTAYIDMSRVLINELIKKASAASAAARAARLARMGRSSPAALVARASGFIPLSEDDDDDCSRPPSRGAGPPPDSYMELTLPLSTQGEVVVALALVLDRPSVFRTAYHALHVDALLAPFLHLRQTFFHTTIAITLADASGLWAKDSGGTSDPYAKLHVGEGTATSSVSPKTVDPVWNETFVFSATLHEFIDEPLLLELFDHDVLSQARGTTIELTARV